MTTKSSKERRRHSPVPQCQQATPHPIGQWKRRLGRFILLTLFSGALFWANGSGARWLLKKTINEFLFEQRLSGSFELQGTVLSGLSVRQLHLTGESSIQQLRCKSFTVDWSVPSLISEKRINQITVEGLSIKIKPTSNDSSLIEDDQQDHPTRVLPERTNQVRRFLKDIPIQINDLDCDLDGLTSLKIKSLSHTAASDTFVINEISGTDHLGRLLKSPRTNLTWKEDEILIDRLTLLPEVELQEIALCFDHSLKATLRIDQSFIDLKTDFEADHQLSLKSPSLDLKRVTSLAGSDLPISGNLKQLEIKTSSGRLSAEGENLQWEDQTLSDVSLTAEFNEWLTLFGHPIKFRLSHANKVEASGVATLAQDIRNTQSEFSFIFKDSHFPQIEGRVDYQNRRANIEAKTLELVSLAGFYDVDSSNYSASLEAAVSDASKLSTHLTGPLQLSASGTGNLSDNNHRGSLMVKEINIENESLLSPRAQGQFHWNWPESVTIESFQAKTDQGELAATLEWSQERLEIKKLSLQEAGLQILSASGSLPASGDHFDLDNLFHSNESIDLKVHSESLSFDFLSRIFGLPQEIDGNMQMDLTLTGSFTDPIIEGSTNLHELKFTEIPQAPPTSLLINLKTRDQKLELKGELQESNEKLLTLEGEMPFLPQSWIQRDAEILESPISFCAHSQEIDLGRFSSLDPLLKSMDGNVQIKASIVGTFAEPRYSGEAHLRIKELKLGESALPDLQNLQLHLTAEDKMVTISESSAEASGGTIKLEGGIDFNQSEPRFDLSLNGSHFLLDRTTDYTIRGNPNLKIQGTMASATISGSVDLVESLFYKEIEILPFGNIKPLEIETSAPSSFSPSKKTNSSTLSNAPSSDFFDSWILDVRVKTLDPILVRGNLASGEIMADCKVFGTIGQPKTSGQLSAKNLVADLPFSELKLENATLTLRPESLDNPDLNLKGTSTVGEYEVQIFLTGTLNEPELLLNSNPPLPDSEIMLLLATGTAFDRLKNQDVASQKALQLLLEGIRRRNGEKNKTVLQRLLKDSDQIKLSLGETDQFSGRNYSAASLNLNDQLDFTAQIDDEGNTRAMIILSIRFR